MTTKNNEFNIMIKIPELNLEISDYDMDYQIYKTSKNSPDTGIINIWNLEKKYYSEFLTHNFNIEVFTQYMGNDYEPLFNGYISKSYTARTNQLYDIARKDKISADILTKIKIINSKKRFQKYYINKDYREAVSSTQIINDCMEIMGIKKIIFSDILPEKLYPNYKAIGKPYEIIKEICTALDCRSLIQNEVLFLGIPTDSNISANYIELNSDNSYYPEDKNAYEKVIITKLKSVINPNDFVCCNFDGFEGLYCVSELQSDGNNYNTEGLTKITITLN